MVLRTWLGPVAWVLRSPWRVFILFWLLIYILNSHFFFTEILLARRAMMLSNTDAGEFAYDKSQEFLEYSDGGQEGHEWYSQQLSRLRPINTHADPFLISLLPYCQPPTTQVTHLPVCLCLPQGLYGKIPVPMSAPPWPDLDTHYADVQEGGYWKPPKCHPRQRVAVIIPQRDREHHLHLFMYHMHSVFQRQELEYRIFVVEQAHGGVFNKALIMNAGYLEARKLWQFDCVVFHDVDMMSEDDRNLYRCGTRPRHMGAYVDKFNYVINYPEIFGGAVSLLSDQFELVNGFSNLFVGWGGEDDDLYNRIASKGLKIERYPENIARYRMIPHGKDTRNPLNQKKSRVWKQTSSDYEKDGLNSIHYFLIKTETRHLYTWFLVEYGCAMSARPFMGVSDGHVMRQFPADVAKCKSECEDSMACIAITWDFNTSNCMLHDEMKKPTPKSDFLYFSKEKECLERKAANIS